MQRRPPRRGQPTVVIVAPTSAAELGQIETVTSQTGAATAAVVVVTDAELVVELEVKLVRLADEVVVTADDVVVKEEDVVVAVGLIGQVGSLTTTLVVPRILQTEVRLPSRMPACTCCGVMLRPRTWLLPMTVERTLGLLFNSWGTKSSSWLTVQSRPIPRGQP